ncbi:MAG: methionyl-tRNA formyltransferase [Coprococcus sp.]|nr:methionyl-tRNA formyltransferase [Coprococcus sp.]
MKIIFMGTPDFSVGVLEALVTAGHEVVLAVTQPDKPKGRGKDMQMTPVKECALRHHIPVFQPRRVREAACVEELRSYNADVCVVVAFGQILPKEILEMTPYGCVNVHASLLPKYRGAAPIQWAVIDGEEVSGVTTMQMDEGIDTGDILEMEEIRLDQKETGGSLHDKLSQAGAKLCVHTLAELEAGRIVPKKQGESPTEYAKMLKKEMGEIDWTRSAGEIERLVRGLSPWPSAYTVWNEKMMKIWEADCHPQGTVKEAEPGTVVEVTKESFKIQTGSGLLAVTALQIPGKKRMDAGAFLRGYLVRTGECLGRTMRKQS